MKKKFDHPLAITMWDFSWLERRWPGAGYENWDTALDELKFRGYDAVRIDAYPHLIAAGPDKEWTLNPEWSVQDWGAPTVIRVSNIKDHLIEFIGHCKRKGIYVALSTWFRQDSENHRMDVKSPEDLSNIWIAVLDEIYKADLMDSIMYVDLCNEYPVHGWCPWIAPALGKSLVDTVMRVSPEATAWMRDSISGLRNRYPQMDYCFSFSNEFDTIDQQDVSFMDLLEPHIWMSTCSDFYFQVGYSFERFSNNAYDNLVKYGESLYRSKPEHWHQFLYNGIDHLARWSEKTGKPLVTTECWGIVDFKDWPMLNWDWNIELCELGVKQAAKKGRWIAIATSNFCGPQFTGMWREVEWHKRMTALIHAAELPKLEV